MDKREFLKGSAAMAAAIMTTHIPASKALAEDPTPTTDTPTNIPTKIPRTNWAGNYHYSTYKVFQPTTLAEVQDAIRSTDHLRALGTRHAFNGIADSTTAQISTLKLKEVTINPPETPAKRP
jgi:xylitol oxidase